MRALLLALLLLAMPAEARLTREERAMATRRRPRSGADNSIARARREPEQRHAEPAGRDRGRGDVPRRAGAARLRGALDRHGGDRARRPSFATHRGNGRGRQIPIRTRCYGSGTRSAPDWARPTASGCCTTPPVARAGCAKSYGSWSRLCYPRRWYWQCWESPGLSGPRWVRGCFWPCGTPWPTSTRPRSGAS